MDNGIASIPPGTWLWWQRRRSPVSTALTDRSDLVAAAAEGRDFDQGPSAAE